MEKIKLPLEEAIELNAKENMERDVRMGLADSMLINLSKESYLEEARAVLTAFGEGYPPDYDDHHLIMVEGHKG